MDSGTIRGIRSSLILTLDLIAILGIFSLAYYYRIDNWPSYSSADLWIITATFLVVLFLSGTYFRERTTTLPSLPIRTFWICIAAGTLCIGWLYILGPSKFTQYFGRGVLPVATVFCGLATTAIRYLVNRIYHLQEKGQELLYLGYSPSAKSFLKELKNHSEVRSVTVATQESIPEESSRISVSREPIKALLQKTHWQLVIVDPLFQASTEDTENLVDLRLTGTPVVTVADFYEKFWFMIPVTGIDSNWFLRSQGFSVLNNSIAQRVKRLIDIGLSLLLLTVSFPIIVLCAVIIKLTSRGPVLYQQTRVGLEGKPFTIVKLRTMVQNAETEGAQWASSNDPRTTWFGRFLRQTRLDEIPQCWNVLRGEMSFVGPRPERPEFTKGLAESIPYYDLRHLVKPGITGWAQVIFPYGASTEDSLKKLQYELFYIKNQSLLLDLNIMIRTLITVFQRAGR